MDENNLYRQEKPPESSGGLLLFVFLYFHFGKLSHFTNDRFRGIRIFLEPFAEMRRKIVFQIIQVFRLFCYGFKNCVASLLYGLYCFIVSASIEKAPFAGAVILFIVFHQCDDHTERKVNDCSQ